MKVILLLYSFFLFVPSVFTAHSQQIAFNKVLPPQGKSFEHVTGITQDKLGYLWLATKRGLYKYDGHKMMIYKSNPLIPSTLVSNSLECLFADTDGTIWVGSLGHGLDHFNPTTNEFTHFRYDPKKPNSISNDTVTTILRDGQGILWVGTHQGLNRFDDKTGNFMHYQHQSTNSQSLSNNQVRVLYEDKGGTLWVGTGSPFPDNGGQPDEGGLNRFDRKAQTFTRYLYNSSNSSSLSNNKIRALYEDNKGNFWVGTAGSIGLHTLNKTTGTFQRYPFNPAHPERPSRPIGAKEYALWDHITFIREDASGALWIGTAGGGLNRYDPSTQKTTHYDLSPKTNNKDERETPWWAYTTADNLLWISTNRGSLFKVDPLQKLIPHDTLHFVVNCFYEEDDGTFLLGTNKGLIQTDQNRRILKRWVNNPKNPFSLSDNDVSKITKYQNGVYWIGTLKGGLNLFNKQKESFVSYRHNPNVKGSISGNFVLPAMKDKNSDWWFGTDQGLNKMDHATGMFTHYLIYPFDTGAFNKNVVTTLLEDRQGIFWAGTWLGGIHQFNKGTKTFKSYLKDVSITGVYEDSAGDVWVGGMDGLYRYNRTTDAFISFADPSSAETIPDVISMVSDNQQALWLATSAGIVRLNKQRNEISLYGKAYNLDENTFIYGSSFKGKDGKLFFGDTSGYFAFLPQQLSTNVSPPHINFIDFRLANQRVVPEKGGPLPAPLSMLKELHLNHTQNIFSIDFAAIDFTVPEMNRERYMLENYDANWHNAGPDQRAYYFNVPPGNYTFRVKAANSKGIWAERTLSIIIAPPWWQTWWAYTLAVLLIAACVWGLIWYRSRRLQKENALLEKKVAERTQQLHQSLEDLKNAQSLLIQQEKMASLGELTAGIAHEIQNPLNFVNNFSEVSRDLLDELRDAFSRKDEKAMLQLFTDIKVNLQKVHHHGHRAGAIVRSMLQHSRKSEDRKELIDLNALVDEYLHLSYHGFRVKDKTFNTTLETHFDKSIGKIALVPQDIGRVLLNLFNNAFYAAMEKKKQLNGSFEPTVSVSTRKEQDQIFISISDNGIGMSKKVVEKAFDPFFTTKPPKEGTGLGLSLSYDVVTKQHGGTLTVRSEEGKGSVFTVQLPIS